MGKLLMSANDEEGNIVTAKMKDRSLMRLDARSRTETWAYWTGVYDTAIMTKLASLFEDDYVVFDVGANVGFYSIALGRKLRSKQGKLYAFEPVPNNYKRILESVELNKLQKVVHAYNIALGEEEGTIEMSMEGTNNASSGNAVINRGEDAGAESQSVSAKITTLDSFAQEHNLTACHLIKIDIEGAEVMFLKGGVNFIAAHRPIIYGEFNRYWIKQFGHSFEDVVEIMKPLDYRFFKQINPRQFVEVTNPKAGTEDVILAPKETPDSTLKKLGVIL